MSATDDEARRVRDALLQLGVRDPRLLQMPLQVRGSLSDAQIRERVLLVAFSEFASDRVLSDWWCGEGMPLEHARSLARELGLASDSLDRVIREVLAPRETGSIAANERALAGSGSSRKATQPSARRPSPNYTAPPATETDDELLLDSAGAEERHGSPSNSFAAALGKEVVNFPLFAPVLGAIWGLVQTAVVVLPAMIDSIFAPFKRDLKPGLRRSDSTKIAQSHHNETTASSIEDGIGEHGLRRSSGLQTASLSVSQPALLVQPKTQSTVSHTEPVVSATGILLRGGARMVGEVLKVEQNFSIGPAAALFVGPSGTLVGTIQGSTEDVREITVLNNNRVLVNILKRMRSGTVDFGNGSQRESERRPLDGLKLLGTRFNDSWHFVLERGEPTTEQSKALSQFGTDFSLDDNHYFPEHRVRNGETWQLSETAFQRYVGRSAENSAGRVSMTLQSVTTGGAQRFARIEADVDITASGRNELDEDFTISTRGKESVTRDVSVFINVESKFVGNAVVTEYTSVGNQKAKVQYQGPIATHVKLSRRI